MPSGKSLGKGAEAELYPQDWEGRAAVLKVRAKKAYRHPELDLRLRKRRTGREAKILRAARECGVNCPELYSQRDEEYCLVLQRINGTLASRLLENGGTPKKTALNWMRDTGLNLAKLHAAGMVHGDFTTSNLMVDEAGKLIVIDFGLSEFNRGLEEQAIDVLLFRKSLASTNDPEGLFEEFWGAYQSVGPNAKLIMARAEKILSRGRYQQRMQ